MSNNNIPAQQKLDNQEAIFLIHSLEWKHYIDFLKARALKLQGYANDAVEKGDLIEARVQVALMKDCQKQINAFVQQTLQMKKNIKDKENNNE